MWDFQFPQNVGSLSSSINVGLRRLTSSVSSQSRAWSKMSGQPLESCRIQILFKSYFQFRFGVRHLELVVNNVRRHTQVGRGRKCGGIFGTMPVCRWKLKLGPTYRPAEQKNLRFFHGGCPWFSSFLQALEKLC